MHHRERDGRCRSDCRHLVLFCKWQRRVRGHHTSRLLQLSLLQPLARLAPLDLLGWRRHTFSQSLASKLPGIGRPPELVALLLPIGSDLQPGLVLSSSTRPVLSAPATCWRTAAAMPEGMAGGETSGAGSYPERNKFKPLLYCRRKYWSHWFRAPIRRPSSRQGRSALHSKRPL